MYYLLLVISYSILSTYCEKINLSDYKYPIKESSDKYIRIAILGTNDFHGGIFPNKYEDSKNIRYSNGGAINLYSYAKILRKQWENQFLWLDGGDQFTGTMECMLSDGNIMRDYYNNVGVDGIGLGNHDFDYGVEYLKDFIKKQKFPVLAANVRLSNGKYLYEDWENVKAFKVYEFGTSSKIRIGVIGLALKSTASQTSVDLSDFIFEDYFNVTKNLVEKLRNEEKVNAVLLLTHFGPLCDNDKEEKMILEMRESSSLQGNCDENEEIMNFLSQIKKENIKIDGVIAAHVHNIVHHWISDIPVIQSSGSNYFNVLYLPFKENKDGTVTLQSNKISIEGPVPVCEKLWPDTKNCEYKYEDSSIMQDFIFHEQEIIMDEELSSKLKYWKDIIDSKIDNIIFETKEEMYVDNRKEALLTNFINDIGKIITESDICFYNLWGLRTIWYKGYINEIDLFNMLPFNNTWIRFEMTGEEVYHMFQNLAGTELYPNSGTIQTFDYSNSLYTLKNILFYDGEEERPLDPNKIYKICTNDFLAKGGVDMGKVRKWYKELKNPKDFGLIRDLLSEYLKNMYPITKEKFVDEKYPRIIIDN